MLKLYCIVQNATPQKCFGPYTYCEAECTLRELGLGNKKTALDAGYNIAPLSLPRLEVRSI